MDTSDSIIVGDSFDEINSKSLTDECYLAEEFSESSDTSFNNNLSKKSINKQHKKIFRKQKEDTFDQSSILMPHTKNRQLIDSESESEPDSTNVSSPNQQFINSESVFESECDVTNVSVENKLSDLSDINLNKKSDEHYSKEESLHNNTEIADKSNESVINQSISSFEKRSIHFRSTLGMEKTSNAPSQNESFDLITDNTTGNMSNQLLSKDENLELSNSANSNKKSKSDLDADTVITNQKEVVNLSSELSVNEYKSLDQSSFLGTRIKKKNQVIDSDSESELDETAVSESEQSLPKDSSPNLPESTNLKSNTNTVSLSNDNKISNLESINRSPEKEINENQPLDQRSFFGIRSKKKYEIIDSDSESDETSVNSSGNSPGNFSKPYSSRISEHFKSLNSDLCSTMVGQELAVIESDSDSSDVVEVSDGAISVATIIPPRTPKPKTPRSTVKKVMDPEKEMVSKATYEEQRQRVLKLKQEVAQIQNILRTVDLAKLPDKGKSVHARLQSIQSSLKTAEDRFEKMDVDTALQEAAPSNKPKPVNWEDIKVESDIVQPKTLGRQALQTYNTQKSLTMERLHQLHGSLSTCPTEDTFADDPKGIKVQLMAHQKHALAWLMWREEQQPSGGILADDMGLGKTLTMISLMLKSMEKAPDRDKENEWRKRDKDFVEGGTLIICPASLVKQWEAEVSKHCRRALINIYCYHGPKREPKSRVLSRYDMVITTYTICNLEAEKSSPLFNINWRRVILDEGHQIRNHKSRTAIAICQLETKSRWILTGTPVHNKELDMYSLLKFLRCTPFDDYGIWKTWIANKDTGGYQRLQTVISSLMLRRTKVQLQEKGELLTLPDKTWEIVEVKLSEDETAIYEKVLMFSRTIFAQYLHQRSNKDPMVEFNNRPTVTKAIQPDNPYHKIYEKMSQKCKVVKQHEILLVLLRLRQCCCHPHLITQMLEQGDIDEDEDDGVMNLMEELKKLDLEDRNDEGKTSVGVEITKKFHIDNPLFSYEYKSKKIETILNTVRHIVKEKREKVIIVSQWTSFLKLIGDNLEKENIEFAQLDGTLKIDKRMQIVQNINNSSHPTRVLLLSLTAGGVGLNLIGANHLVLVDIHWNPQLESQAQDRIYRVGQNKPVHIYKFITKNTIEERIKSIQDHKLSIADSMLTGSKVQHTKLSLQDLRMLFNM